MKKILESSLLRELLRVTIALTLGLSLGFVITALVSKDPVGAYSTLLFGPLSQINRIGDWLEQSITLILAGLAISIVFRAKLWYIGVEGQMIVGATMSGLVALNVPLPPYLRIPLAFIAGAAGAMAWGIIPAVLKAYLNANELVASLMLNTIALKLFEYALKYFIMPPLARSLASPRIDPQFTMSSFIPNLPFLQSIRETWVANTSVTWIVYVTIACVIGAYLLLFKTKFGYELRTMGSNPQFASYGGINVKRTMVLAIMVSGIFAGFAGVHLTLGIYNRLLMDMTAGLGFEGIIVSTLAANHPLGIPFTGLLYGYLKTGADVMERSTDVPRQLVAAIQAVVMLLITAERLLPAFQKRIAETSAKNNKGKKALKEGESNVS